MAVKAAVICVFYIVIFELTILGGRKQQIVCHESNHEYTGNN
jgi:hypothetical protein